MSLINKRSIKDILGGLPLTAEVYWYIRQTRKPPVGGYSLERLRDALPGWMGMAGSTDPSNQDSRQVLIFGMLPYWIEHTSLMALSLAGLGHDVTLAYLPYAHWKKPINRFDLRRQNLYINDILKAIQPLVDVVPMLDIQSSGRLPSTLAEGMSEAAFKDVQYSLLREDVDRESSLYALRLERNTTMAAALLTWLQENKPDVIIVPNGSMLEFGIVFQVARYLDIPVMTFEFGEQSERMWLAQNADVMRQETGDLWSSRRELDLTDIEWQRVREFFASRQGGGLWENFSRRWQGTASKGGEQARIDLGLDTRPLVLLPTNVLGDSLTLGRQIFSHSMTKWLRRTIHYFSQRSDWQFVIRVHPGEQIGWGPSVYDLLQEAFPELPTHIHLLPADAGVNTYDLVNTADLGLVFTTTLGLEMAMVGLPVIVTGQTHYRDKGFTIDPDSWDDYFDVLDKVLAAPELYRPSREQVEMAWTYAYRFFFEYPRPYPWHVQHFWDDVESWPLDRVLADEGLAKFAPTFQSLVGDPIDWQNPIA
jgi:hypothetical protein